MKRFILFLLVSFCFLASCDVDGSGNTKVQVKFDQKTFIEQRQLWQDSNIKNYQYQLSAIGFVSYHGIIFVENGNLRNDLPSAEHFEIARFMEYSTIDEIYKIIEEIFNYYNKTKQSKNDAYITEILIEYDTINHIPNKINYKCYVPSNFAIDGTFYYEVTNFSRLVN